MASYHLIINSGSASKKYALAEGGIVRASAHLERGADGFSLSVVINGREAHHVLAPERRGAASELFVAACVRAGVLVGVDDISALVFRLVAPGGYFTRHRVISQGTIERLRGFEALAPSHIRATLEDIEEVGRAFPARTLIGCSDSAFHTAIPAIAREFALDPEFAATHDVYRFGYHGLSTAGAVAVLADRGELPRRLIVVHAGGGISASAVEDGMSAETSMGFMPLTGLPMATRAGDIDAGALLQLLLRTGEGTERLVRRLYHESGLINYANMGHGGIKDLLVAAKVGNHNAARALAKYSYHMRKEIAALAGVLGGVDAVVLTGTALVRSPRLRALTLAGLAFLEITPDLAQNEELGAGEGIISAPKSTVIEVMKTHEMDEMAKAALEVADR